jgi:hypothetical protein
MITIRRLVANTTFTSILALASGCIHETSGANRPPPICSFVKPGTHAGSATPVAVPYLIDNFDAMIGQRIAIRGFAMFDQEGSVLFPSRAEYAEMTAHPRGGRLNTLLREIIFLRVPWPVDYGLRMFAACSQSDVIVDAVPVEPSVRDIYGGRTVTVLGVRSQCDHY